jgi:hypothetical protein
MLGIESPVVPIAAGKISIMPQSDSRKDEFRVARRTSSLYAAPTYLAVDFFAARSKKLMPSR